MKPRAFLSPRIATLAALLLAACVIDPEDPGKTPPEASTRSFKGFVYADSALGYRFTVPSDWHGYVYTGEDTLTLDFWGFKQTGKFILPGVIVTSEELVDSTLRARVEYRNDGGFRDSAVVRGSEFRGGVEVIPVDRWYFGEYVTERSRRLYFFRNGQVVLLEFSHAAASFDTSSEIRFIDSSLTFF